jgi:hypothetical protein
MGMNFMQNFTTFLERNEKLFVSYFVLTKRSRKILFHFVSFDTLLKINNIK